MPSAVPAAAGSRTRKGRCMDSLSSRIAETAFPLVKRGYDPAAVDAFKASILRAVTNLEEELTVINAKASQLQTRLRSSSDADTVVQTAFLAAAEAKSKLLQEAEARGVQIIAAAEARAAAIDAAAAPERRDSTAATDQPREVPPPNIGEEAAALLEEARLEAESIIAEARRVALEAVGQGREAVMERADEAREELHRLAWLLKTVKQAVHNGLAAAEAEAPELQLVLNDQVDLGQIVPLDAKHTLA